MQEQPSAGREKVEATPAWKAAKHLLPFFLVVGLLAYWGNAYVGEKRAREQAAAYRHANDRLSSTAFGRLDPPIPTSASPGPEVEAIRRRLGIEGEETEAYVVDPRRLTATFCEEPIVDGSCPRGEARFRIAYPFHFEQPFGFDSWVLVLAPEREGHFTRDPVRIVYVAPTGSTNYALLTDEPREMPFPGDESIISVLDGFPTSPLGEEIGRHTNDNGVARLNPLDLAEDEWRFHGEVGSDLPLQEEIYEVTSKQGPVVTSWLGGDGDLEAALSRITLVSAAIGALLWLCRFIWRFLAYTAKGFGPLALLLKERIAEKEKR